MNLLESLKESVIKMDKDRVTELTKKALDQGIEPGKILYDALTPAMEVVGQEYDAGNIFIPEMLMSAESLRGAMEVLKPILSKSDLSRGGKVVIGTVAGDIHNIGKEIVCMMLEGAGFEVFDLGVDVPSERFVEKAKEANADIVGMSAFLSTTGLHYAEVIDGLREAGLRERVKVIIGGAAASQKYSDTIGADGYGANASAAVKLARSLVKKK